FGSWLLLISLYFIFSKAKYLGAFPISVVLFIIITSLGPQSVYSYPEARQFANLQRNLAEAGILLESREVMPLQKYTDIDAKLSGEIYGGIDYLCNYHGCNSLAPIFANEFAELEAKAMERFEKDKQMYTEGREYEQMRSRSIVEALTNELKVRRYSAVSKGDEYKTFNAEQYNRTSVQVTGYDYFVSLDYMPEPGRLSIIEQQGYRATIDIANEKLKVYKDGALTDTLPIQAELAHILSGDDDALTFVLSNDVKQIKVVLSNITIMSDKDEVRNEGEYKDNNINIHLVGSHASGHILIQER
ncbi:MAG: hypothetical protein LRZ97_01430, partial [Candidatus Pacebacteria bacterium]|nr:hypothetical protein [Candidatus Paceibacterota bacterium]